MAIHCTIAILNCHCRFGGCIERFEIPANNFFTSCLPKKEEPTVFIFRIYSYIFRIRNLLTLLFSFSLFAALTYMKNLESLNVSKNRLKRLPLQLCECSRLNELNISDNIDIWHIPERISYMQSLQMLSADRKLFKFFTIYCATNICTFSYRLFFNIFTSGLGKIHWLLKNFQ